MLIERAGQEADQRAARAEAVADQRVAQAEAAAGQRVAHAEAVADQRLNRMRAEFNAHVNQLENDLAQTKRRADRAEQWLALIRKEVEGRLMPSFAAMHDRMTRS